VGFRVLTVGEPGLKNLEVARILNRIADLLEFTDENPFKVRAYRRGADTVESLAGDVESLAERGTLIDLPGIGKDLAKRIDDICRTGTTEVYEDLRGRIPPGLLVMTTLPGVGPKTARLLWEALAVDTLEKLESAAREQKIRGVRGLGAKKEETILRAIEQRLTTGGRVPYHVARKTVDPVLEKLRALGFTVESAGSMRRWKESIGDADFVVAHTDHALVTRAFLESVDHSEVIVSGDTKTSVRTVDGFQLDLRVVEPASFGAALVYFTGSKNHNIRLRGLALSKGLSLNEYGFTRESDGVLEKCATEAEVYERLGLPFIPPEIREDSGEIEAALAGQLPDLVELSDIRGDLHSHTTESDGTMSLPDLARAAKAKGYEYLAITDHTQSLAIAHGLDPERIEAQRAAIDAWNEEHADDSFRLLAGSEVDILADGALDLPDETLKSLDFVVASLHAHFRQPREEMTARVCRAVQSPFVDVMGHPTARLLDDREPVDMDFDRVLAAAKKGRTAMELNASPHRMDLSADHLRQAKRAGIKIVISTDTHRVADLEHMPWGVHQARRGWIEKKDVLNTLSREQFLEYVCNQER
jgi:DNA polymerase (family 10)